MQAVSAVNGIRKLIQFRPRTRVPTLGQFSCAADIGKLPPFATQGEIAGLATKPASDEDLLARCACAAHSPHQHLQPSSTHMTGDARGG